MCGAELTLHGSAKTDPSFGHFCHSFLRSLRLFAAISFSLILMRPARLVRSRDYLIYRSKQYRYRYIPAILLYT
jgi:hypothetical protein